MSDASPDRSTEGPEDVDEIRGAIVHGMDLATQLVGGYRALLQRVDVWDRRRADVNAKLLSRALKAEAELRDLKRGSS